MAASSLRRDHSIVVRVVEARQLPADCQDTYCVIRIDNNTAEQVCDAMHAPRPPTRVPP